MSEEMTILEKEKEAFRIEKEAFLKEKEELDKKKKDFPKWVAFIFGVIAILIINGIFLGLFFQLDLKQFSVSENFLIALIAANTLILGFGILSTKYKFSMTGGRINIEEVKVEVIKQVEGTVGLTVRKETDKIIQLEIEKVKNRVQVEVGNAVQKAEAEVKRIAIEEMALVANVITDNKVKATHSMNVVAENNVEDSTRGILFDTNKTYDENAVFDMMTKKRISAYGTMNHLVDRLQIDDRIFFYQKGEGIIAVGKVISEVKEGDVNSEERYCEVEPLTKFPTNEQEMKAMKALTPSEIRKESKNFYWASTIKVPYLYGEKEWGSLLEAVIERVGKPS